MVRRLWKNDSGFGMITMIVIAATAYVWVSGFGSVSSEPAKSMALTSQGALTDGMKSYVIASATPGLHYDDLYLTVNGQTFDWTPMGTCGEGPDADDTVLICSGRAVQHDSRPVAAGDSITLRGVTAGETLRIIDANSNSVIMTLTIG